MKRLLVVVLVSAALWQFFSHQSQTQLGPGIYAPDQPAQSVTTSAGFIQEGYRIIPLADFRVKAKVLSRRNYHLGKESDLSPTDLALGWGPMSDEAVLEHFDISQRNRWYFWRSDSMPISRREVVRNSANMHIIPANEEVVTQLKAVRQGDIIELEGNLVRVEDNHGWRWMSSLSREDTGDGSCELIWVSALSIQ